MAKKQDGRVNNGGPGRNQGRKPGRVPKKMMTVSVPKKYIKEIKQKTVELAKTYEEKCLEENKQ